MRQFKMKLSVLFKSDGIKSLFDREPRLLGSCPPLSPRRPRKGREGGFGAMRFGILEVNSPFNPAAPNFVRPKKTEKKVWYGWSETPCMCHEFPCSDGCFNEQAANCIPLLRVMQSITMVLNIVPRIIMGIN